ncbi:hypothetical protein D3C80_208920 [compost metagenome]
MFIVHRRAEAGGLMQAATFGQRRAATDFSGQPPPAKRAPDHCAKTLIRAERHQIPLVITADQGIIDLIDHITRPAITVRDGKRFHDLPAGKIRDAGISHLAGADECIERRQHFLNRCEGIEGMELQDVDVVGL